ncbi:MAG: sulfite exporter TauE/SafE family protein [Ignavibacteriales bacterium]|nr:sulfite exporter TauE/SafE family protein [Ignavibacteriales bacterium]
MEIEFLIILLVFFIASFIQSLTGFGFAIISIPVLTIFLPVKHAIPLGALCGFVVNFALFLELRKNIKFSELKDVFIGAIIGVPLGVFFLSKASPELIKISLGIILLSFVIYKALLKSNSIKINPIYAYVSGFFSGLLGGAFNTSGPPIILYYSMKNYDKVFKKAQITGYFIVLSFFIVSIHFLTGLTTENVFWDFVRSIPVVVLGIIVGSFFFSRIRTEIYDKIILIILFLLAIYLILSNIK